MQSPTVVPRSSTHGSTSRIVRIDLLPLHRLDPACPIADQVGALAQLQQEGMFRHIGLSEVTVEQLEEARRTAPSRPCRTSTTWPPATTRPSSTTRLRMASPSCRTSPVTIGGHAGAWAAPLAQNWPIGPCDVKPTLLTWPEPCLSIGTRHIDRTLPPRLHACGPAVGNRGSRAMSLP
ncbi:aldo/keto reductase [Streptomyces chartreusis]|uniref:aldo/keto reductase n=1 Tax=Streptomyces chartreusis TaxID=1969 RepID=UPI0038081503